MSTPLIASICIHHTHLPLCLVTCAQPSLSETNDFYSANIALLGWFLSRRALLQRPHPCIESFVTFLDATNLFSYLYRLNIMWMYFIALGADTHVHVHTRTHTHTHTPMSRTKAILRTKCLENRYRFHNFIPSRTSNWLGDRPSFCLSQMVRVRFISGLVPISYAWP